MSIEPIRRSVTVAREREAVFRLFTEGIGTWWPVESHSRAVDEGVKTERIEFPTRVGGEILEHLSDGRVLPWGALVEWEPPERLVLSWHPTFSERPPTELEVRFTAVDGGTLVELEHRGWERLGPDATELMQAYTTGWPITLERFRAAAEEVA